MFPLRYIQYNVKENARIQAYTPAQDLLFRQVGIDFGTVAVAEPDESIIVAQFLGFGRPLTFHEIGQHFLQIITWSWSEEAKEISALLL